jgi:hypothetical protein
LGVAILAIILLSAGLAELEFQPGKSLNLLGLLLQKIRSLRSTAPPSTSSDGPQIEILVPIFWVLFIFSIIFAIISPRYRKLLIRTFFLSLGLVIILNTLSEQGWGREGASTSPGVAAEQTEIGFPDPPAFVTNPPDWFLVAIDILLVFVFLGAIWLLWRLLRPKPDPQTLLAQEAEIALTDLRAGGDLKNVVLRCYARMGQVLRRSRNIRRDRAMTPREFEGHLAEIGLRDEHIQRLTRLFEGVRYGAKSPGLPAEREAIDCLKAIVQAYGETA